MNWAIDFYNERVHQEIKSWPDDVYADFLHLAGLLHEHGVDLRMPHSRAMGRGLFELRCRGREGSGRAFYCMLSGRTIVILHSFIKKTNETPDDELRIARKRQKEAKDGK
ncbi:MAG: type II toxin-antitoxin system RelE/ParE family toxin [Magnetococcales bacterium]|nr:type II toxin-antitoxin system RelE/ParE family toxin [Magnetococcales bacterium]MBF0115791.1 type II toxin-antitoxin system RelE/ParE family toxin [Magnetococcales bacterium]